MSSNFVHHFDQVPLPAQLNVITDHLEGTYDYMQAHLHHSIHEYFSTWQPQTIAYSQINVHCNILNG